jgi:hypothetical protein
MMPGSIVAQPARTAFSEWKEEDEKNSKNTSRRGAESRREQSWGFWRVELRATAPLREIFLPKYAVRN